MVAVPMKIRISRSSAQAPTDKMISIVV